MPSALNYNNNCNNNVVMLLTNTNQVKNVSTNKRTDRLANIFDDYGDDMVDNRFHIRRTGCRPGRGINVCLNADVSFDDTCMWQVYSCKWRLSVVEFVHYLVFWLYILKRLQHFRGEAASSQFSTENQTDFGQHKHRTLDLTIGDQRMIISNDVVVRVAL